ncbi:hypothetical protein [Methylobacterium sp. WL120]|uniref:hypothetical protein n=1 Tax=Methylobacterium sp. WL120 TaxID=2603887 RepID=UPI0011C78A7D|nr:hypothetical protein [Methylobacterium sp. WL120]TXM55650.1 hypothetical protein FV229_26460 [Methylobacterium sp. WL120]
MPKIRIEARLKSWPVDEARRRHYDDCIDTVVADAKRSVAGHPQLGHLEPDLRFRTPTGRQRPAVFAPAVMMKALEKTTPGKTMKAEFRREVILAILDALIDNDIELTGRDDHDRYATVANAKMLKMASGWYRLEAEQGVRFEAVLLEPHPKAAPEPTAAPQPRQPQPSAKPTLQIAHHPTEQPKRARASVYDKPIPEEAEEAPDIDAMLAMMGNLPPRTRTGH